MTLQWNPITSGDNYLEKRRYSPISFTVIRNPDSPAPERSWLSRSAGIIPPEHRSALPFIDRNLNPRKITPKKTDIYLIQTGHLPRCGSQLLDVNQFCRVTKPAKIISTKRTDLLSSHIDMFKKSKNMYIFA